MSQNELFYALDLNQLNFYHLIDNKWVLQTYNNPITLYLPNEPRQDSRPIVDALQYPPSSSPPKVSLPSFYTPPSSPTQ